jgi:1-acyl-sn-glycerol-3-phosphate acyltransferase
VPRAARGPRLRVQPLFGVYCLLTFTLLGTAVLVVNLFVPTLRARRRIAAAFARGFFRSTRLKLSIEGAERLPQVPCVVVANHASYLDGLVACAALPPEFAFVIKKEMVRVPLAGLLLRRLGSEFVERSDRQQGAADARRVLKTASTGQSLVFFPEGTFDTTPQIGKFHRGAFATAERTGMPIVAVAIHGTRQALPSDSILVRRTPIRFEILAILEGDDARSRSRELIAQAVGEPLA